LCKLSERLVRNDPTDTNFDHFKQTVTPHLSAVDLSSDSVFILCNHLEMKGKLGPHNLGLLKKAFPKERDVEAFESITNAEHQINGSDTGNYAHLSPN